MPRFRPNPHFPAELAEVRADWARMCSDPRPLVRPVLVLAGWRAPAVRGTGVATALRSVTSQRESDFLTIAYPWTGDLHSATRKVLARVAERWPSNGSAPGAPLDVVGISMGGLVARLAASGTIEGHAPLNIARLFTMATPHLGAKLARVVPIDRAARDMRPGSRFLHRLNETTSNAPYDLVCYAQLRDWWVGATNAAPEGRSPFWTDTRTVPQHLLSHFLINSNRAVLRDIARRLRNEDPVATAGTPPPTD